MLWLIVIAAGLWLVMVWRLLALASKCWEALIEDFEEDEE